MSENELLSKLASKSSSFSHESVDVTARVMKSIHEELSMHDILEIEQESFSILYWASGISIAATLLLVLGLNLYFNFFAPSSFNILGFLVSS